MHGRQTRKIDCILMFFECNLKWLCRGSLELEISSWPVGCCCCCCCDECVHRWWSSSSPHFGSLPPTLCCVYLLLKVEEWSRGYHRFCVVCMINSQWTMCELRGGFLFCFVFFLKEPLFFAPLSNHEVSYYMLLHRIRLGELNREMSDFWRVRRISQLEIIFCSDVE